MIHDLSYDMNTVHSVVDSTSWWAGQAGSPFILVTCQYSTVGVLVMVSSELVVLLIVCISTGSTQGNRIYYFYQA